MEIRKNHISVFLVLLAAPALLNGCILGKREIYNRDNTAEICGQMLKNCFGEEYTLSVDPEKEETFYNEYENRNIVTHYTEWTLTYTCADGQERNFVFNNRCGQGSHTEHLEKAIGDYFSDLAEQYYKEHFWDKASTGIPGLRKEDCVLYIRPYRLFSMADVPETSVMFDERLHYALTEHIYFPELAYDRIFHDFPYIMHLYIYAAYETETEKMRNSQRQEIKDILLEMISEMILYTDHSLNAEVHITMMDENRFADSFSFAVLKGEYFAHGPGTEFEIDLHENFFGPIKKE